MVTRLHNGARMGLSLLQAGSAVLMAAMLLPAPPGTEEKHPVQAPSNSIPRHPASEISIGLRLPWLPQFRH